MSGESGTGKPLFGDVTLSPETKNIGGLTAICLLPFCYHNTQIQGKKQYSKKQLVIYLHIDNIKTKTTL
jgi:hypothetical protein